MGQYSFQMFLLLETMLYIINMIMVTNDNVYLDLDSIAPHNRNRKE